ncbi:hypothetical protein SDJN03_09281, partial [Cucurbita argyrosperma subsp. sororia]
MIVEEKGMGVGRHVVSMCFDPESCTVQPRGTLFSFFFKKRSNIISILIWAESQNSAFHNQRRENGSHFYLFCYFSKFFKLYFELMASKLHQLQSKACQASQFAFKHGSSYYKQLLEQNKQYIQEPATVEKCSLLSNQLLYTRLASIPGRYESFWKELDYVKNLWKNRQELKVEDAGIAALFGLECFAWFCAGEIVGRGFTITGYYV